MCSRKALTGLRIRKSALQLRRISNPSQRKRGRKGLLRGEKVCSAGCLAAEVEEIANKGEKWRSGMAVAQWISGEVYFVTITVVDWIDVFTRPRYKHIVVDSLLYCQQHKGLEIYAWVLMTNHLHAIVSAGGELPLGDIIRDFKKFTSKRILNELQTDLQESRRDWMLGRFQFSAYNDKKIRDYRFWQDGYHPVLLTTGEFFTQKLDYIHANPVRQEFVARPEEYLYSSAFDFAGGRGMVPLSQM